MQRIAMRPITLVGAIVLAMSAVACDQAAPPASAGPAPEAFLLRATYAQALPPEDVFAWAPPVAITGDRTLVTLGAVPAIFPGPLLPNLRGRTITRVGYDRIVGEARSLGLLDGDGDFAPPDVALGAQLGRIELLVDGEMRELIGDPSRVIQCVREPCIPPPGTPEAFAAFWQMLTQLPAGLESEFGPEFGYRPDGYAILIGVEPTDEPGLPPGIQAWPLDTPLMDSGRPIAAGQELPRCATFEGADVAALTAAFELANQLTRWVDRDGAAADAVSIAVRPLLPGEDVCRDLYGIGS